MRPFQNKTIKQLFEDYPQPYKRKLLKLRELIFDIAESTKEIGELEEAIKWGEPSYVTSKTKSGSTIRLAWKPKYPDQYAIYFNCKTTLVDSFKQTYGYLFNYEGNRSIVFSKDDEIPEAELGACIKVALTYHLKH
jgi:hypothetical protein